MLWEHYTERAGDHQVRLIGQLRRRRQLGLLDTTGNLVQGRRQRQTTRRDDQQGAPVHRVGPGAAPQPEHDQRHQTEDAGQADVGRTLGQGAQLNGDGEDGQVGPDDRRDARPPQAPEIRLLQRCGVGEQPPHGWRRSGRPARCAGKTRILLCTRFSRPCQNSTTSGATR